MTLAEKITALRGERKLSQGDVAEKLDVSRQSVSKWETGQAVPELDKIIKLADLFGVSVDELVRDGETPAPEAPKPEVTERVVYLEKPPRGLTPIQVLGVVCAALGAGLTLLALIGNDPELIILGPALIIFSLPLLLAKKHPLLICGWLIWAAGWLTLCNPYLSGMAMGWLPFPGVIASVRWIIQDETIGGNALVVALFLLLSYTLLSVLTVALPVCTGRLCWKRWKGRGRRPEGEDSRAEA